MRREKITTITSVYLHVITIAYLVLLISSAPALGDCTQKYPDSYVIEQLESTEYQNCKLDVMIKNYTNLLKDQRSLLLALKPAYVRKLEKELHQQDQEVYLDDYEAKLKSQEAIRVFLEKSASAVGDNTVTEETSESQKERREMLRQQLEQSRECGQALKSKIVWTKEEITDDEKVYFCNLDFLFRVDKGLNSMIAGCLGSSN